MKLNVSSLRREDILEKFKADLQQKLIIFACNDDPTTDTLRDNLKSAFLKTSSGLVGYAKKEKQGLV